MRNPWVIIGGSAMGIIDGYLIENKNCKIGDKIILTKPLGA